MVKKFKPRNEKFEIRKIPGNKIGRGEKNQYQDQIVQFEQTDGSRLGLEKSLIWQLKLD